MPRVKEVGGRTRKAPELKFPGAPIQPTLRVHDPDYTPRLRAGDEEAARQDRYILWGNSHAGGSTYDFLIHDYLLYHRKLTESDFRWQATVDGARIDYYFPGRQMGWNLASKRGLQISTVGGYQANRTMRQASGLYLVDVFVESLDTDPNGTLDAAWTGIQR